METRSFKGTFQVSCMAIIYITRSSLEVTKMSRNKLAELLLLIGEAETEQREKELWEIQEEIHVGRARA
jgi:hypothetical protein